MPECIIYTIQTTPGFRKDDQSNNYADNPTALSLLITLTGADVFKTGDSGQLPYEFVIFFSPPPYTSLIGV